MKCPFAAFFLSILFLLSPAAEGGSGAKSTIIATPQAPAQTDKQQQLYDDQEFTITSVGYGTPECPQTPAVYLFGKKNQRWFRVEKVALKDAVLGRSPIFEQCRVVGKIPPPISWDFRTYAKQEYVDLPLSSDGFLFFPKIERNDAKGQMIFRFNSDWKVDAKIEGVETVLIVSLEDLKNIINKK